MQVDELIPAGSGKRPGQVFYGWWVLGIISFMAALNNAFFDKGPALFLIPVGISLALNRATASLIFSLGRSEGAVNGPIVGYLVNRFGARKIVPIVESAGATVSSTVGHALMPQPKLPNRPAARKAG